MKHDVRSILKPAASWTLLAVLAAPWIAMAADSLESLGLEPEAMQNSTMMVLRGGYYAPTIPQALRQLPGDQKRAAVRTIGAFVKAYVGSAEFKKVYGKAYKDSKPKGFGLPSLNVDALAKSAADKALGKDKDADQWKLEKDPAAQLRKRLESFLSTTADVDFDAAVDHGRFESSEYEAKPPQWKMCYRAGKDAADEARAFAKEWLEELSAKK